MTTSSREAFKKQAEKATKANEEIFRVCQETIPFIYCHANNISMSMTGIMCKAFKFDKERNPGNRKLILEEMQQILDYEKEFVQNPLKDILQ
jgi:hypothetical protein